MQLAMRYLAAVSPLTIPVRGYPFKVFLPEGLPVSGVIPAGRIRSLDRHARWAELIATLPNEMVAEVPAKIRPLLD